MGAKQVAAGAEWLDENVPGWEEKVDLNTLRMYDCNRCILGQTLKDLVNEWLVNGYAVGIHMYYDSQKGVRAWDGHQWAKDHGFSHLFEDEVLWIELIKERFNLGNLSGMQNDA